MLRDIWVHDEDKDPLYDQMSVVESREPCSFGRALSMELNEVPARPCPHGPRHELSSGTGNRLVICEQHMRQITAHYWVGVRRAARSSERLQQ